MKNSNKYARQTNGGYRRRDKRPFPWIRAAVWFLLTIFIFSLGVYTGRKYHPVILEKEALYETLASIKKSAVDEEEEVFRAAVNEEIEDAEYEFYEDLKETTELSELPEETVARSETVLIDKLKKGPVEATNDASPAHKKVEMNHSEASAGTTKAPQQKNIAAGERTGKVYTIQVASSKDKQAAQIVAERLKKEGWPAYIQSSEVGDKGLWHRVRVGYYGTKEEAHEVMSRLAGVHLKGYLITLDGQ